MKLFNLGDVLIKNPKTWLVTGVAGFIGSNILEALLKMDQRVMVLIIFNWLFRKSKGC